MCSVITRNSDLDKHLYLPRRKNMSNIQISNLSFQYEGSFDTIFDKVNLHLDTTWKLGFIG